MKEVKRKIIQGSKRGRAKMSYHPKCESTQNREARKGAIPNHTTKNGMEKRCIGKKVRGSRKMFLTETPERINGKIANGKEIWTKTRNN